MLFCFLLSHLGYHKTFWEHFGKIFAEMKCTHKIISFLTLFINNYSIIIVLENF